MVIVSAIKLALLRACKLRKTSLLELQGLVSLFNQYPFRNYIVEKTQYLFLKFYYHLVDIIFI